MPRAQVAKYWRVLLKLVTLESHRWDRWLALRVVYLTYLP